MNQALKSSIAAALLCGALVSGSVSANQEEQFGALGGVEAQSLTAQEMDAIHGAALTAIEAAYLQRLNTSVTAAIAKVANPDLRAKLTAAWTTTLARLTAFLTKY
jgi:hypothetical protein